MKKMGTKEVKEKIKKLKSQKESINPLGYLSDYAIMDLMEYLSQKLKKSRHIYFRADIFDYKGDFLSDIRKHSMFSEDRNPDSQQQEELKKIAEKIVDEIFDGGDKQIQLAKLALHKIAIKMEEREGL